MSLHSMYWLQVLPGTALTPGLRLVEGAATTWVITIIVGERKGGWQRVPWLQQLQS